MSPSHLFGFKTAMWPATKIVWHRWSRTKRVMLVGWGSFMELCNFTTHLSGSAALSKQSAHLYPSKNVCIFRAVNVALQYVRPWSCTRCTSKVNYVLQVWKNGTRMFSRRIIIDCRWSSTQCCGWQFSCKESIGNRFLRQRCISVFFQR